VLFSEKLAGRDGRFVKDIVPRPQLGPSVTTHRGVTGPDTSVFVLDQPFEVVLDVGEVFAVVHVVALAGDAAAELLPQRLPLVD